MNKSSQNSRDFLQLHFIVLLFGFTAVLGKLITIDAMELVAWRMGLAALGMAVLLFFIKPSFNIPQKTLLQIIGTGVIVAIHWIFFFLAVKVSNVSVTLGCMASGTLFTSILEPLFEKRKIWWVEVVIGLVIIFGLYIITQFAFNYYLGIAYALFSAFMAVLFGVINKQFVKNHHPLVISFTEMVTGSIAIVIFAFLAGINFTPISEIPNSDWQWLLVLAWICTAYAFLGIVHLLKRLSAYSVSLAINLEPVYGIILAYLIFGESEKMDTGFYLGAIIILLAVSLYPILERKFKHKGTN